MPEAKMSEQIAVNSTKIEQHDKHLDRIDATVEKLTEVSISLREIVKNHEEKHIRQESANREFYTMLEERRTVHEKITEEIKASIVDLKQEFQDELKIVVTNFNNTVAKLNQTLAQNSNAFSKYKYLIWGGIGTIFIILDKWSTIVSLFPTK